MMDELELDFDELDAIVAQNNSGEIDELTKELSECSQEYYSKGTSKLSDRQWDAKYERLRQIDPNNPILTQVGHGYDVDLEEDVDEKEKYEHPIVVGSITKTKDVAFLRKKIGKNSTFSVKLDGNSIVAYYRFGVLDRVVTRGKDNIGIDRTNKFKTIIPNKIDVLLPHVAVRGEAVILKSKFNRAHGFDDTNSSRNTVAGLISRKDGWEDLFKHIDFIAYTFIDISTKRSIYSNFKWDTWFNVEEQKSAKIFLDSDINEFYDEYKSNWKYDADGTVFIFDDLSMLALKYEDESVHTDLEAIKWTIGVDQRLTPIAILKPVKLSGATITKASLGSFDRLKKLSIWPKPVHCGVNIIRANEIIPYVKSVGMRSYEGYINPPNPICPECGKESEVQGKHVYCVNDECPNIEKSSLLKFASFFYPDGISDKQAEKLFNALKIKNIAQLLAYDINKVNLNKMVGVGDSLAMLAEILFGNMSGDIDSVIVYNSVVNGCGKSLAKNIVKMGVDINQIYLNSKWIDVIKAIPGFPNKVADSIWKNKDIIKEICRLRKVVDNKPKNIVGSYCVTGVRFSKTQMAQLQISGWVEDSSVKKTTRVLVTNDPFSSSTKTVKAQKYGVPVMDMEQFFEEFINED